VLFATRMTSLRAAGFIVYRVVSSRIEYLMMQTSYGQFHWTPPKGHVDPGESDMETAVRETEEEAGLEPQHIKVIEDFRKELYYTVREKPKTVVYWLAELVDNKTPIILSDEHKDFKWVDLEEARKLGDYVDFQNLLKECDVYLKKTLQL